jgi:hypothetical protein
MRRFLCAPSALVLVATAVAIAALITAPAEPGWGSPASASACPVRDSGTCIGILRAGRTYTSRSFRPKFTFRVPARWANYLDIPGLYLLQPPGANPPGNSIEANFIGLETRVAPEARDCQSHVKGVRTTPTAIAAWMWRQRDLVISHRRAITVGGLRGIALDIRMVRGAKGCLSPGATKPAAPLLVGIGLSSFDHEVAPGNDERHYLLAYNGGTLDIQMVDTSGGKHLAGFAAIVSTFRFGA